MISFYLIFTACISVITIIAFASDKIAAKSEKKKRIPESVLLTLVSLGGAPGGLIGMYVFRHKTSFEDKFQFAIGAWFSFALQAALAIFIALLQFNVITIGK